MPLQNANEFKTWMRWHDYFSILNADGEAVIREAEEFKHACVRYGRK